MIGLFPMGCSLEALLKHKLCHGKNAWGFLDHVMESSTQGLSLMSEMSQGLT